MNQQIDSKKQEAFAGRLLGILNEGSLAVMVSVGHRTGLFDRMAGLAPSTSASIAEAAGLKERYVREWLGAMVTGRIVDYDPSSRTYSLPVEHAASLTRAARSANLAPWLGFVPFIAKVEERVVDCFRKGGGVPYSVYEGFAEALKDTSEPRMTDNLVDVVLPLVPGLVASLERGVRVLEVGCGTGHALTLMAKTFPASRFTGYDLLQENIAAGNAAAKEAGLENVTLQIHDVAEMDHADEYDVVTAFDTVHDQARPDALLAGIARALKPGGTFLMADVKASTQLENNLDHPIGPFGYAISCMHCMTVSLAYDGMGLGAMWGEEKAKEMLEEAGFELLAVEQAEGDPLNNYYIARKPA